MIAQKHTAAALAILQQLVDDGPPALAGRASMIRAYVVDDALATALLLTTTTLDTMTGTAQDFERLGNVHRHLSIADAAASHD